MVESLGGERGDLVELLGAADGLAGEGVVTTQSPPALSEAMSLHPLCGDLNIRRRRRPSHRLIVAETEAPFPGLANSDVGGDEISFPEALIRAPIHSDRAGAGPRGRDSGRALVPPPPVQARHVSR
jgi:hypothetical protein